MSSSNIGAASAILSGALTQLLKHYRLVDNAIITFEVKTPHTIGNENWHDFEFIIAPLEGNDKWDCPLYNIQHPLVKWGSGIGILAKDILELDFYFITSMADSVFGYLENHHKRNTEQ